MNVVDHLNCFQQQRLILVPCIRFKLPKDVPLQVNPNLCDTCNIDFETRQSYKLDVNVTDYGEPVSFTIFSIDVTVTDENDAPRDLFLNSSTIDENAPIKTIVGYLSAIDEDVGQTLTFSLVQSTEFEQVGVALVTKVEFDYETQDVFNLNISVTDNGSPALTVGSLFLII